MSQIDSMLDQWCENVPGLVKVGDGFWSQVHQNNALSYPVDGLNSLASVEPTSFWFNHRNDAIVAAVSRYPAKGLIFDIGGGNGYVSSALRQAGFDSIVVEPSQGGVTVASSRGLPVIRAAFEELDPPDESIWAAGLFDVLEHIDDDIKALKKIRRTLRRSGILYIAVPAYNFLWSAEDRYAGHYRRYTKTSLAQRLTLSGFEVLYSTYLFSALVPVIFFLRALPSWASRREHDSGRLNRDHSSPSGASGALLRASFQLELKRVSAGKGVFFGSSCLAVARRI